MTKCPRCGSVPEDPVTIGMKTYCMHCTCADCGVELSGLSEEQVCNVCLIWSDPSFLKEQNNVEANPKHKCGDPGQ